ncbi:MAG: hypothetical protein ACRDQB_15755, partial [Thermocrispum sp.]
RDPDNRALVDVTATEEITDRVSAALKAVFSYNHANLDRTERAVDLALTGAAERQYLAEFTRAAKRAERGKLVRSSTVRSLGVRTLTGDRATLLVFLDQQTLKPSGPPSSATATLDVTAVRTAEGWRISRIVTL